MAVTLATKKKVVAEIAEVASKAISAVIVDYRGLTVNQMTELRREARKIGVYVRVIRNTLARRAFSNTEFSCLDEMLEGPVFLAFSLEAPSDAARMLKEFIKTFEQLKVKGLAVNGKAYEPIHFEAIASLPTRNEALAKLMYIIKAPVEKLARTLAEPHAKLVRTIAAIKDTK